MGRVGELLAKQPEKGAETMDHDLAHLFHYLLHGGSEEDRAHATVTVAKLRSENPDPEVAPTATKSTATVNEDGSVTVTHPDGTTETVGGQVS